MKTLQQLEDATDDELRVMLAELLGWTAVLDGEGFWRARHPDGHLRFDKWVSERNVISVGFPNFPQDLNACFEVVDTKLNGTQYAMFAKHLGMAHPTFCISVLDNRDELEDGLWQMASLINADARLRTIALILTLQQP